MTPSTVVFIATGCGVSHERFGATPPGCDLAVFFCGCPLGGADAAHDWVVGNGPTQNVRSSEIPDAHRSRIRYSPSGASGAILTWALAASPLVTFRSEIVMPLS